MAVKLLWPQCAANKRMNALRTIADRIINLSAIFGALGLLFEVGVVLTDVIGRAFGKPLYGSQDLETMAMVILVFGGMAACDRRGGHIAVDLLQPKFSTGFNRFIDAISAFMGAVIFLAIAYAVYESLKLSLMLNLSTNLLNLQKYIFQWALVGFALLTSLGLLLRAIELASTGRNVHDEHKPELG